MTTRYFIRTEETIEDAWASLERGKSVRRWAYLGATPWEHLAFAIPADEQRDALEEYGLDTDEITDLDEFIHGNFMADHDEQRLHKALNLSPVGGGGYAEFLDGLCSLEEFVSEPQPEDCSQDLDGELLPLLVCYEGEAVGIDPDDGWILFRPTRIVWTHETGSTVTRERNI